MAELGFGGISAPLTDDEARELLRSATITAPQPAAPTEPTPLEAIPLDTPFEPVTPEDMPLQAEAITAAKTTPQATAFDLELQEVLGLPAGGVTDANRDMHQRSKVEQDIENQSTDAPVLRGFMRLDADLTALASGSIDNLAKGERATRKLTFSGALSNGVTVMKSLGYRFVEAVGEVVSEDLEAFAQAEAERLEGQLGRRGHKQRFKDIWSGDETAQAGKLWDWMRQTAGEVLPLMAPSLAGGAAGFVIGGAVGGGVFSPATAVVGSMIGAFIPGFILGTGETQGSIKQRDPNTEAPGTAFAGGVILGAFDTLLAGKLGSIAAKAVGREAAEEMFKKIAFRTMAINAARQGLGGATVESITEGAQFYVSETFAASATGTDIDPVKFTEDLIENMAAGALMGLGATTVTSVGSDVIKARRVKRAMDESSQLEKEGSLKGLSPEKAAELKVAQLKAAGVDEVFVPLPILLDWASTQEDPVAALEALGVPDGVAATAQATDPLIAARTARVAVSLEKFAQHIHGTEAYDMIAPHLTITPDAKSLAEGLETIFSSEEDIVQYTKDVEQLAATDRLKAAVAETVAKAAANPSQAHKIIEKAGREVETMIDVLVQKVEERKGDFASTIDAARAEELDAQLALADQEIAAAQDDLAARIEDGRATKRAQNKVDKLIAGREALQEEAAEITFRSKKAAVDPASEESLVPSTEVTVEGDALQAELANLQEQKATADTSLQQAKDTGDTKRANRIKKERTQLNKDIKAVEEQLAALEARDKGPTTRGEAVRNKFVKVKAKVLLDLGVKVTKEAVRQARAAFKLGVQSAKHLNTAKRELRKEVKKIKGLTKEQMGQLVAKIDGAGTLKQLQTVIKVNQFRIPVLVEKTRKAEIKKAIENVLKKTKTTGGSKNPRSKFTAPVQDFFNEASEILRLRKPRDSDGTPKSKMRDIEAMELELNTLVEGTKEDPIPPSEVLVRIQLLSIATNSKDHTINSIDMENLLITLNEMYDLARKANLDKLDKTRKKKNIDVRDGREFTTQGEPTSEFKASGFWSNLKKHGRDLSANLSGWHNGWDEVLDIVFNKRGVDASRLIESLRLTKEVQKHKARLMRWEEELREIEKEIFGLKSYADLADHQRADQVEHDHGVHVLKAEETEIQERIASAEEALAMVKASEDNKTKKTRVKAAKERLAKLQDDLQEMKDDPPGVRKQRLEHSKAEIRKLWMEHQDPTLVETIESAFGMGYSKDIRDLLFDQLTDQDKAFARAQLDFYKRMYKDVNRVYRQRFGVDLPFNEFYSPIQRDQSTSREGGKDTFGTDLVFTEERTFRRELPHGTLTRVDNVIPLMRRSDIGAMHRYMHEMSWFIEASEKVLHIKSVFKDTKLEKDIITQHGNNMKRFIDGYLEDFGPGYAARGAAVEKIFATVNRQFASSVLSLKASIGAKQLVSWFAMADGIPAASFLKSHVDFFKTGKDGKNLRAQEIVKFLWENSPALRARGSSLDFELAKIGAIHKPLFTGNAIKVKGHRVTPSMAQWEEWKFAIIKLGDRMPIYAGGWAVYQHAIKQGKTKEQAIEAFEDAFSTTQQSTDIDKLSGLQRAGPMGRTLTMFMTARMALLRGELRAIRQRPVGLGGRGKIGYREFGKRMAYYHFMMPMMIQWIASGFEFDEDRQAIAAVLGQLNSFVIFGDVLATAAEDFFTEENSGFHKGDELPTQAILRELWAGVHDAIESGGDTEDLLEAAADIAGVIGNVAGQPVDQAINIAKGAKEFMDGNFEVGGKQMFGISEKIAQQSSR